MRPGIAMFGAERVALKTIHAIRNNWTFRSENVTLANVLDISWKSTSVIIADRTRGSVHQ
jgi:nuclear transport factor 2 (NTF2) superfamily protein